MSEITISEEARKAAHAFLANAHVNMSRVTFTVLEDAFQLAINASTSTLLKRIEEMEKELDWQNNRNSGHPTKGGFEFYINEEWTGLAAAALNVDYGWHAALRKQRIDPDDERVRVRRVAEDDTILKQLESLERQLLAMREAFKAWQESDNHFPECSVALRKLKEAVNSTPAELARKYVKREVLEKCVEALDKYSTPHGGKEKGGKYWSLEDAEFVCAEALSLARKELETK